ncbi:MAG: hypothetical protein ACI38A_03360 [Candidatus Ornithomonoglobus sp.]
MAKHKEQTWAKQCRIAMIQKGITVRELASSVGYSYQHVSSTLTGRRPGEPCRKAICKHLGVDF